MRVYIETPFSGILKGKLLSVSTEESALLKVDRAAVMITSRGHRVYPRGKVETFPLTQVAPADCFRIARQRKSGKLFPRCNQDHSRAELFAPYRQDVRP